MTSHFLIGERAHHQHGAVQEVNAVTSKDLIERGMLQRELMDMFWSTWVNIYLRNPPPPSNIYRGQDGLVCSVKLHTTKGTRIKAIQRLHDLEISNIKINNVPLPSDISKLVNPSQSKFRASIVKTPLKTRYGKTVKAVERFQVNQKGTQP